MFGMVQVCNKRRPNIHEQRFQLDVLRARNQCFVERLEHLNVVRDLVIDVGLIECRAL